jgi:hypothetical protein
MHVTVLGMQRSPAACGARIYPTSDEGELPLEKSTRSVGEYWAALCPTLRCALISS